MEDDLNLFEMEDDLNILANWMMTLILGQMNLNVLANGRQHQVFG